MINDCPWLALHRKQIIRCWRKWWWFLSASIFRTAAFIIIPVIIKKKSFPFPGPIHCMMKDFLKIMTTQSRLKKPKKPRKMATKIRFLPHPVRVTVPINGYLSHPICVKIWTTPIIIIMTVRKLFCGLFCDYFFKSNFFFRFWSWIG